jgi:hypothetical protein
MNTALTTEQVNRVVENTVIVLLDRADLLAEWHANLYELLTQTRAQHLDDESIFIAAVLALLHSPRDALPTGTAYDRAWEAILIGLQTGSVQSLEDENTEVMTIDRLLKSVAEAVVTVMLHQPGQKEAIAGEIRNMYSAANDAGAPDLANWLADILALLNGAPAHLLGSAHVGIYAQYWDALARALSE